jgi:hypothetical protein
VLSSDELHAIQRAQDRSTSDDELTQKLGANVLRLARSGTQPAIMTRRIETIEFLDEARVRRTVECHLRLDAVSDPKRWPRVGGQLYVPLTLLPRRSDSGLIVSVLDEAGGRVPRLTTSEERELVLGGVLRNAQQVLGRPPRRHTGDHLGLSVLGHHEPDAVFPQFHPDDSLLTSHSGFVSVLHEAHRLYYVIAALSPAPEFGRRVVTFSFCAQPEKKDDPRSRKHRFLRPQPGVIVELAVPGVGDCLSSHVEMLAPDDLAVPPAGAKMDVRKVGDPHPMTVLDDDPSDRRVHFFYDRGGPIENAVVRVPLMLANSGLAFSMRAAAAVSCLIVAYVATASWFGPRSTFEEVEPWVTVLLVAPAIATAIVAIRSGHGLTSRLSRDTRMTAVLPAFVLFWGAVFLVRPHERRAWQVLWGAFAIVAVLAALRLRSELRTLGRLRSGARETL